VGAFMNPIAMSTNFNPFSVLLDAPAILGACARSGALQILPVSVSHSADRESSRVQGELAAHDAAVEEIYRQAIEKAAMASTPSVSAAKPKKASSARA
jgi:hypothetical protein